MVSAVAWLPAAAGRLSPVGGGGDASSSLPDNGFDKSLASITASVASARFRPSNRLSCRGDFDRVLATPDLHLRNFPFSLFVRMNPAHCARIGFIIGKRYEPLAVRRNRIRRLAREQFRIASFHEVDVVLMAHSGCSKHAAQRISRTLSGLFAELEQQLTHLTQSQSPR